MKKHFLSLLTITGFVCMSAVAWFSNNPFVLPDKTQPYEKLWKKVDSCEKKGLTESALKVVEIIYEKAKTENNSSQLVKALLNQLQRRE